MWQISRDQLRVELRDILAEAEKGLNIEQIIHQFYYRRDRLGDLMVMSRESMRHKQRLYLEVLEFLDSGLAEYDVRDEETYYTLRSRMGEERGRALPSEKEALPVKLKQKEKRGSSILGRLRVRFGKRGE